MRMKTKGVLDKYVKWQLNNIILVIKSAFCYDKRVTVAFDRKLIMDFIKIVCTRNVH